jgi:L-iditol 2-dehydrogenase
MPAVNALKVEAELPNEEMALTEPLGCVVHSIDLLLKAFTRYRLRDADPAHRVDTVLIFGGGPAGLLFTQYLRSALGYEGRIVVSEPNPTKRELAESFGATTIDPSKADLAAEIAEMTGGCRAELIIDASGAGAVFTDMFRLLRKQGTVLMYGHGHTGVDLSVLNNLQFLEPTMLSPVGASGGFEPDGRPSTYRRALGLLETSRVKVGSFITHRYHSLDQVPAAFAGAHEAADYVKGVVLLCA